MEDQDQGDDDALCSIELENLPTLVLENIVGFLDYGTRRTCRLVSKELKTYVETGRLVVSNNLKRYAENGLSIKIDSREPASLKLSRKVTVSEAHVHFLKGDLNFKRFHLENWKNAIFSGPIDTNFFFNSLLRNCSNLRFLMIRGDCLVSQDFILPKPNPLTLFQHLTDLHIRVNSKSFFGAANKLGPFRNEQSYNRTIMKLDTRVQKNMGCVLRTIRSQVLKVLYVMVGVVLKYPDEQESDSMKGRWEHEPLFEFIQAHCNSLEEILSPVYIFSESPLPQLTYKIPTKLKLFSSGSEGMCTSKAYWKDLILAQTSLEKLSLCYINEEVELFPLFLRSVITNSLHTLTNIYLNFTKVLPVFDMKMLKYCNSLTTLSVDAQTNECTMVVTNLNELPRRRLKYLQLAFVMIGPDFDGIAFLEDFRPINLTLAKISTHGQFGDNRNVFKFVQLLMHCRTLNFLRITLDYTLFHIQGQIRKYIAQDDGLECWFSSIGASIDQCSESDRLYLHTHLMGATHMDLGLVTESSLSSTPAYIEAPRVGASFDYLALTARPEMMEIIEQPYHIPRNADSYTIWMNPTTKAYRFQPNYNSYTMRIDDAKKWVYIASSILEIEKQ